MSKGKGVWSNEDSATRPIRLLLFLHRIHDLDLLAPIALAARADPRLEPTLCAATKLLRRAPSTREAMDALGVPYEVVSSRAVKWFGRPRLGRFDALLNATESTQPNHAVAHRLTARANRKGLRTYTLQQGLENVGLTYFDDRHDSSVRFAAQRLLIWGRVEHLPAETPRATAERCVAVGCSKIPPRAAVDPLLARFPRPLIAVFENFHWYRYSEHFRTQFLSDLKAAASAAPEASFIIKPHPKGLWSVRNRALLGELPANAVVAAPGAPPWNSLSGPELAAAADRVITTPSTVALDAARADTPVAIAAYDLDLPYYAPLPLLRKAEDWRRFVAASAQDWLPAVRSFRDRVVVPGDAAARIIDLIVADFAGEIPAAASPSLPRSPAGEHGTRPSTKESHG